MWWGGRHENERYKPTQNEGRKTKNLEIKNHQDFFWRSLKRDFNLYHRPNPSTSYIPSKYVQFKPPFSVSFALPCCIPPTQDHTALADVWSFDCSGRSYEISEHYDLRRRGDGSKTLEAIGIVDFGSFKCLCLHPLNAVSQNSHIPLRSIRRNYSSQFGTESTNYQNIDLSHNPNTNWITGKGVFLTYTILILIFQIAISSNIVTKESKLSWTVTNVSHMVITFIGMHWVKGSPNHYGQGELNGMTWYEQLRNNEDAYNDLVRNGLRCVPTCITYLAVHYGEYDRTLIVINGLCMAICLVAKMDSLLGVRVLGINRTPGIDDRQSSKEE